MRAKLASALVGAKRSAILAEIRKLRVKITEARIVKTNLNNVDRRVSNSIRKWVSGYSGFQAQTMSPIVVINKFEGDTAEKIQAKLPEPIDQMETEVTSAENVQVEIGMQIEKLDQYIEKLQAKIDALQAELAAL